MKNVSANPLVTEKDIPRTVRCLREAVDSLADSVEKLHTSLEPALLQSLVATPVQYYGSDASSSTPIGKAIEDEVTRIAELNSRITSFTLSLGV